ncbi:MAG: hypothetical protein OEV01_00200 [Nitrospira sp.]|nr:hypothetical protein [Nitrospira sp.]MDH4302497.1 hypothetical protein [Nitrospira sp.]MDH5192341.1 hypothetical protein [Nitrospira sp.]
MSEDRIWGSRSVRVLQRAASLLFGAVVLAVGFISVPAFAGPPVPFSVSGTILTIDTGDVNPAGQSGRFIVRDRHITGTLTGAIGGTTGVPFVITYDANVPLATQSGRIHARMIAGVYEANMTMASSTGPTPVECEVPDGATCFATPGGNFVPGLLLNGRMNFQSGAKGQGNVTGWLIPILDEQGHIVSIAASLLTITGQWTH